MRTYKKKEMIRKRLIESLITGEGIRTKTTSMVISCSCHWWLTGTEDNYRVHCYCYNSGQGWRDYSDDISMQDLEEVVSYLWRIRADIIE